MFFPSGSQIAAIIRAITSVVGAPGMKIEKEGKRENENERPSTQTPAAMTAPYLVFSVRSHDKRERERVKKVQSRSAVQPSEFHIKREWSGQQSVPAIGRQHQRFFH